MKEVPLKILIVEDEKNDLELILNELKKADFEFVFRHCDSEVKFRKIVLSYSPDIILSDHNLPTFSSIDALVIARNHDPYIPFILVSGFIGEDEAVDMIVNKGANDFIFKDSLNRLNPSIKREYKNYILRNELEQKTNELKRLSLVASHTHNGVVITNNEGEIEWVNEAYTNITGYTLNDCYGLKPGTILQGKQTDTSTINRISKKLKEEVFFREEILNYKKDGTPYWIKLDVTPIINDLGELTNYIAIQEDITEQKEFEIKLVQTNSRLERAQRIGSIGDWEFNLTTNEVTWSNQVFDIYERDLALGNPSFEEIKKYHFKNELASLTIDKALLNGTSYDIDTELITKKGKKKYIRTVGLPIKENGELIKFTGVIQDITARKQIENELILNESKLKSITDTLPGVVMRYKLFKTGADSIEFISEAVEHIFEVEQERALKDCDSLWSLIIPEDVEDIISSIRESAENMSIWRHAYRIKTKSGKLKWMQAVGVPKTKTNEYVVWDIMVLEITQEKEYKNSLIEANKRLLEAQKLAKIGDWSIDFITNETYISPMVKEIHGVDAESEWDIGKGLSFFKEGYDRDKKTEVVEKAIKEGVPYNEELQLITATGEEKWVRSIGNAVLKQGKCVRLFGTIMDITEEKEKELVILKNKERLDAAVSGADLGLWDLNLATGEHHANNRWFEMLGYSPEGVNYSFDFFMSIIHPEDTEIPDQEIKRIENGGENNLDIILRLKDSTGDYKRILARGKVVEFDTFGKAKRMVGTHLDITDSLELQESLSNSLEEKTVLLSEVHHRVKNNLAIVSGLLELQAMESADRETVHTLSDMAKRIKSIAGVHELLYNSKNFSEISFRKYVSNLFTTLDSTFSGNVKIDTTLEIEHDLEVNINQAIPLGLLINELVTNSYKYAFNQTPKAKIFFKISFDGNNYEAVYSDNGIGFSKQEFDNPSSLGFTLVRTLLAQLGAEFEIKTDQKFEILFKFSQKVLGSHSNI